MLRTSVVSQFEICGRLPLAMCAVVLIFLIGLIYEPRKTKADIAEFQIGFLDHAFSNGDGHLVSTLQFIGKLDLMMGAGVGWERVVDAHEGVQGYPAISVSHFIDLCCCQMWRVDNIAVASKLGKVFSGQQRESAHYWLLTNFKRFGAEWRDATGSSIDPAMELNIGSWSVPDVFNLVLHPQPHSLASVEEKLRWNDFDLQPSAMAGDQSCVGDHPKLICGPIEGRGEQGDCNTCQGRESRRSFVEEFSSLNERDQGYVISGAVFVIGLFAILAVLYVRAVNAYYERRKEECRD